MAMFGASYAALLLVLSIPRLLDILLFAGMNTPGAMPLLLYVNAFAATITLMQSPIGVTGFDTAMAATIATFVFSVATIYLLQRISVMKFNALRCT